MRRRQSTANGVTAVLAAPNAVAYAGLSYSFDATGSTDSNAGATITGYAFAYGDGNTSPTAGNITETLPSSGITAVALNLTATDTIENGVVVAYGDGTTPADRLQPRLQRRPDHRQRRRCPQGYDVCTSKTSTVSSCSSRCRSRRFRSRDAKS